MSDILMRTLTTPSIKPQQRAHTHTHSGGDGLNKVAIVSQRIEYEGNQSTDLYQLYYINTTVGESSKNEIQRKQTQIEVNLCLSSSTCLRSSPLKGQNLQLSRFRQQTHSFLSLFHPPAWTFSFNKGLGLAPEKKTHHLSACAFMVSF